MITLNIKTGSHTRLQRDGRMSLRSQLIILHLYANGCLVELIVRWANSSHVDSEEAHLHQTRATYRQRQSSNQPDEINMVLPWYWQIVNRLLSPSHGLHTYQNVLHCEYKTGRRTTSTGISVDAEVNSLQLHGTFVESFDQAETLHFTEWLSKGRQWLPHRVQSVLFFF